MVQETIVTSKISLHTVCGPTAVGKTAHAVRLARQIDGEIISADSGQIYRRLDIGTAKPTREELQGVPIHLIDILDPDQKFSAAQFQKLANEKIEEITTRGKRVIVCGGTGLYLRVLLGGIFEGPEADPRYRATLEQRITQEGADSLHRELANIDPEAAASIPVGNRHRLIRALEVYHLTQKPISAHWREHRFSGQWQFAQPYEVETTFLNLPREELYRRIEARVDQMMAKGWLEEVRGLVARWGRKAPGLQIIGYKELACHLAGELNWETTVDLIKQHTRNYAKRQVTWFRKFIPQAAVAVG